MDWGTGTILKGILAKIGIKSNSACRCDWMATTMDAYGPQWCQDHKEIILDWLEKEAGKQNILFSRIVARFLLNAAIRRSFQKIDRFL